MGISLAVGLWLFSSSVAATSTASVTQMTVKEAAQIAIDLAGASNIWQSDEIMGKIHKNDPFIKWAMDLNLHSSKIFEKKADYTKYEVINENLEKKGYCYETDSDSEDGMDPEVGPDYRTMMLDKGVKQVIPNCFLVRSPDVSDEEFLYDLIAKMTRKMFAEFFQCCYEIIHDNNFDIILFETIIKNAGMNPYEYYVLIDQYDEILENQMISAIPSPLIGCAVENLLAWVREEDLLRRHTEISIKTNYLELMITTCDASVIQRMLDQLECKLGPNVFFSKIWMWNIDFSQDGSSFSHIHHRITRYLTKITFDSCIFKDRIFSVIKRESTDQGSILTDDEQVFLNGIKQLRINKSKIIWVDDSLRLLTKLVQLNIHDFGFIDVPEPIYQMKSLKILKLRRGKLCEITDDILNLTELTALSFTRNQFESIPLAVTRLKNLVKFAIADNQITELSTSLKNMENLSILILDGNKINTDTSCKDLELPMLHTLSMKNCELDKLPDFVKNLNLKKLSCPINKIASLYSKLHTHLPNLEALILSENNFRSIPATIGKMNKLNILTIGSNIPTIKLNIDSFNPPAGLKKLVLQNCKSITGMPDWIFTLSLLNEMAIINCNIRIVPPQIAQLENLTKIKLVKCNISKFPDNLTKLLKLKLVHLGENPGIKTISPLISKLQNLETLIMYECGLEGKLCGEVCQLAALEYLNVSNNFITMLPKEIGNLKYLKRFDISYNCGLKQLPNSIGNMHSLVIFRVSSCDLKAIPDAIGNLKLLESFDVGMNRRITELPSTIGKLSNLLKFACNETSLYTPINNDFTTSATTMNLSRVENSIPESFSKLYNIRMVNFSRNLKLHVIPEFIVTLRCMRVFSFSKCGLKYLPDAIYELPQLQMIKADMNTISTLGENIANLKHLKFLILFYNNIRQLPSSLEKLTRLEILRLALNKFPESYRGELIRLGIILKKSSLKIYEWSTVPQENERNAYQVNNEQQYPVDNSPIHSDNTWYVPFNQAYNYPVMMAGNMWYVISPNQAYNYPMQQVYGASVYQAGSQQLPLINSNEQHLNE